MTVMTDYSPRRESPRLGTLLFMGCVGGLLLAACAGPRSVVPNMPPVRKDKPAVRVSSLERQVHRLVNGERRRRGLPLLEWDAALARIARKHSLDMAERKFFSHESPEGHDLAYRYGRAGFRCSLRLGNTIYTGAENIFQNNLYDSVVTMNGRAFYNWNSQARIAETTVQGWMKSPGHRKNILTPVWKREGIGVSISPDGEVYITQDFC